MHHQELGRNIEQDWPLFNPAKTGPNQPISGLFYYRCLHPEQHIKHIAPNAHAHINTKGVLTIDPSRHLDNLLGHASPRQNLRQAQRKPSTHAHQPFLQRETKITT